MGKNARYACMRACIYITSKHVIRPWLSMPVTQASTDRDKHVLEVRWPTYLKQQASVRETASGGKKKSNREEHPASSLPLVCLHTNTPTAYKCTYTCACTLPASYTPQNSEYSERVGVLLNCAGIKQTCLHYNTIIPVRNCS